MYISRGITPLLIRSAVSAAAATCHSDRSWLSTHRRLHTLAIGYQRPSTSPFDLHLIQLVLYQLWFNPPSTHSPSHPSSASSSDSLEQTADGTKAQARGVGGSQVSSCYSAHEAKKARSRVSSCYSGPSHLCHTRPSHFRQSCWLALVKRGVDGHPRDHFEIRQPGHSLLDVVKSLAPEAKAKAGVRQPKAPPIVLPFKKMQTTPQITRAYSSCASVLGTYATYASSSVTFSCWYGHEKKTG